MTEPIQTKTKDWWDALSIHDKKAIELSISESEQGKTVKHSFVSEKIKALIISKR